MTTITKGTISFSPSIVRGYAASTESRNIVHTILGRAEPDISLQPDTLRRGELELGFVDLVNPAAAEAAAFFAMKQHQTPGVFVLYDFDRPAVRMRYVREGRMSIELDDESRHAWILTVGFQEVI